MWMKSNVDQFRSPDPAKVYNLQQFLLFFEIFFSSFFELYFFLNNYSLWKFELDNYDHHGHKMLAAYGDHNCLSACLCLSICLLA